VKIGPHFANVINKHQVASFLVQQLVTVEGNEVLDLKFWWLTQSYITVSQFFRVSC